MSNHDYKSKRLGKEQARKLVVKIMREESPSVFFSKHALDEMGKDSLSDVDVLNILLSPASRVLKEGECHPKYMAFTYQFGTRKVVVVIQFWPDGSGLNIVTAWKV